MYYTTPCGDLWVDYLYEQSTTWAFLLWPGGKWRKKKKRKIQWQSVGWNSGSDTANCVFLLTFNSPKHPCFTAPWAIAFLNLSLERQELWSLSIEEKGMLFPCHLLVAPPSSLPWSTVQHPPIPFLFPTLLCRKLEAKSLPLAVEMRAMEKCSGGEGEWWWRCSYWFRGAAGSCTMVLVLNALVLC